MNRYESIPQKKTEDGKRVVRSTIYPPIPRKESDIYIRTTIGDRVELIAYQFYGDVNMWWLIAEANAVGKGSFALEPGTLLRVPQDYQDVLEEYEQLNN
jgi:hypothetical protein